MPATPTGSPQGASDLGHVALGHHQASAVDGGNALEAEQRRRAPGAVAQPASRVPARRRPARPGRPAPRCAAPGRDTSWMLGLADGCCLPSTRNPWPSPSLRPEPIDQSFSVSPLLGCHFISRRSSRPTSAVEHQRERGQHQDAGHHGVDVERALGLQDQVAHAARGAEVLADHRADEGQAHAGVQRAEHPARGAGQVDVAQQLPRAGAEHACVGQHHRAHLLHALVDVEEDDEEHQRHAERHLARDAQAEPHREDRRQDHARHRVQRLDVGVEDRRGHRAQRQPQAAAQAQRRADAEGQHRLDQGDPQVLVDVGVADEPGPDARRRSSAARRRRRPPGGRSRTRTAGSAPAWSARARGTNTATSTASCQSADVAGARLDQLPHGVRPPAAAA